MTLERVGAPIWSILITKTIRYRVMKDWFGNLSHTPFANIPVAFLMRVKPRWILRISMRLFVLLDGRPQCLISTPTKKDR